MQNIQISRKRVKILGIGVDSTTPSSVLRDVQVYVQKKHRFYIVTPNPEQVLLSLDDPHYARILNNADISVPDGIGLVAANNFLKSGNYKNTTGKFVKLFTKWFLIRASILFDREGLQSELKIIHGRELFLELIKLANKYEWRVFLLGGENGEVEKTKQILKKNYKRVRIESAELPKLNSLGKPMTEEGKKWEQKVIEVIESFSPHLLFIGMTPPKQEKWMDRFYDRLNALGTVLHGGTFRYISGQVKLPPGFVQRLGLEWLWRLATGSQNLKRIWNSVFVFSSKVFWSKYNE